MKDNLKVSPVAFVSRLHEGYNRSGIVAFPPGAKKPVARNFNLFHGDGQIRAGGFVQVHSEGNLYFQLNPAMDNISSQAKQSRATTKDVIAFHVDIDPDPLPAHHKVKDPVEWTKMEQERIHGLLTYNLPKGAPEPSIIIFSGGGFQAIWLLREPIRINGDIGVAEDAALYNVKLEWLFGADNTHNIDRLLRLPGTMNRPHPAKRKKGRTDEMARLIKCDFDLRYDLSEFQKGKKSFAMSEDMSKIDISEVRHPDAAEVEGLLKAWNEGKPKDIQRDPATFMAMLGEGRGIKPKEKDDSRSAWWFDAACHLQRIGLDSGGIVGIMSNPDLKISESMYHNADGVVIPNPIGTTIRQVKRAIHRVDHDDELKDQEREETNGSWLEYMNDRYCVVKSEGGKTRVFSWGLSDLVDPATLEDGEEVKFQQPTLQTFGDIQQAYVNQKVMVLKMTRDGPKEVPVGLGHWWLEHPERRTYQSLKFAPHVDEQVIQIGGNEYLNLWNGFGVDAAQGSWKRMQDHILHQAAKGNKEHYDYIIRWLAFAVQFPEKQAEVALTFRGSKGTGKGVIGRAMCKLFGNAGLQVSSSSHLTGKFNAHLRGKVILFADEAVAPDDRHSEAALKRNITEDTLTIEMKGYDPIPGPNMLHIIIAGNDDMVIRATADERRYAVFEINEKKDQNYYKALYQEMNHGGYEAMLYDLQRVDLTGWHPRQNIPNTDALQAQKLHGLKPTERWLFEILQSGELAGTSAVKQAHSLRKTVMSNAQPARDSNGRLVGGMVPGLYDTMRKAVPGLRDQDNQVFASFLKEWGCTNHRDTGTGKPSYWLFPTLKEMRGLFEAKFGHIDWGTITDWDGAHHETARPGEQKEAAV